MVLRDDSLVLIYFGMCPSITRYGIPRETTPPRKYCKTDVIKKYSDIFKTALKGFDPPGPLQDKLAHVQQIDDEGNRAR